MAGLISAAKHLVNTASNHEGETLQRWRAVGDTVSNLNSPGVKLLTSHTGRDANTRKLNTSKGQIIMLNVFAHLTVLILSAVQLHAS